MISITIEKNGRKKEFINVSQNDLEFIYETLILDKEVYEPDMFSKASRRTLMKVLDFKEGVLCS